MKINELPKEELETMSYDDIAYLILKEEGNKIKITDLFKKICDLLGLSNAVYENKITSFFQILSTDQRFIMLENGFWDLKINHKSKIVITEDDEDDEEEISEEEPSTDIEEDIDDVYYEDDTTDDDSDDDLKDLMIVNDEDEENTIM
jgi:DNA-directed RNA polymerase subunit delta